MSGPGTGISDSGFQDRLNRVNERRAPIDAARPQVDVLPDWKANIRYPATLVGMAFLGMFAVFFARFVRFHLMGGTLAGEAPDITMMIDAGLAAIAGVGIFMAVGITMRNADGGDGESLISLKGLGNNPVKAALVVGIAIMIGTMHNMVHSMPSAFGLLFSEEWKDDVVAYSEPGSIYFRGNYYVVLPQAETTATDASAPVNGASENGAPATGAAPEATEDKVLPKVRRL